MNFPYGLIERCLLTTISCFLIAVFLGPFFGISKVFFNLAVIALPSTIAYTTLKVDPKNRAVLITGCDSGFGFALAQHLHELGFIVFAGCLTKDKGSDGVRKLDSDGKSTGRLITVQLDVTSDEQVEAAVKTVKTKIPAGTNGLWAVVNNAGFSTFGEMEWVPLSQYEMVASINLFGIIRVTKGFLPLVREAHGRVVNVASMMGRMGGSGRSAYCATKFAVEAISDCLRLEMKKFHVDVTVIEPGNFIAGTSIFNSEMVKSYAKRMWEGMSEEVRHAYRKDYFDLRTDTMLSYTTSGVSDIKPVIDAMTDAVSRTYPRNRYQPMAPLERIKISVATFLPEIVFDTLFG